MIQIKEITTIGELDSIREAWQFLLNQTATSNLFLTPDWISIWLRHFWLDKPLRFILVHKSGNPLALAPFLYDPDRGEFQLPVNGYSHRPDILLASEKAEALKAIFSYFTSVTGKPKFYFHQIDLSSDLIELIPELDKELGLISILKESHRMPYLKIEGDWESYLQTRSKHFRKEQRRKLNKIGRAGSVVFKVVENPDECVMVYDDVLKIERNSWKESTGTSFTADPRLARFYKDICHVFSDKGKMRIYMLYFNGTPVAHIFGINYKGIYFALKTSYDKQYRHLSPGIVLFNYALADAFETKFKQFDFLGVESRWKSELTPLVREHADIYIYSSALMSAARKIYEDNFKPFVRNNLPFLLKLKRKLFGPQNNTNN